MSFNQTELSTRLTAINSADEAATKTAWSAAWRAYFIESGAGAVPFTGSGIAQTAAQNAMIAAMNLAAGFSVDAPATVQAGIIGWWDHLVANPATFYLGASSITKPSGLTGIASGMPAVFALNQLETTRAPASNRMTTYLHTANLGGSANISGSQPIS